VDSLDALAQLGAVGIMAIAVLVYVRMAKQMIAQMTASAKEALPSENLQTQMFGFLQRQMDITERLETKISDGDDKIGQALEGITTLIAKSLTKQDVVTGAVNSMTKQFGQMAGVMEQVPNQAQLAEIMSRLDVISEQLAKMTEDFSGQVTTMQGDITAIRTEVKALAPKPPPVPQPRTKREAEELAAIEKKQRHTYVPEVPKMAGGSKTNAQRKTDEQEVPAVKPDNHKPKPEPPDKPPTDTIPSGG
jgi:hypothetical protein